VVSVPEVDKGIWKRRIVYFHGIISYMDSACRVVSGEMRNTMWFLIFREIWPCKVGIPEE
jgi:hypothetical protein